MIYMVTVKDLIIENQDDKDTIFIHFTKEKRDKFDPLITELWSGWLKDIPDVYTDYEIIGTGQSLADLEDGITGFYIEIKEPKKNLAEELCMETAKREAIMNAARILEQWKDTKDLAELLNKKARNLDAKIDCKIKQLSRQ